MRKAFDANVPKLKPRLKPGAPTAIAGIDEIEAANSAAVAPAPAPATATANPAAIANPTTNPTARRTPTFSVRPERSVVAGDAKSKDAATARAGRVYDQVQDQVQVEVQDQVRHANEGINDVLSRKDRLDKIKRKVAEAARPQPHVHPVPADPARAAESVLGLVRDLEGELVRARAREEALGGDLDDTRRELGRAASEGRTALERLGVAEKELEQKRSVLGELLGEMQALEEERDESVRRAQALASLDEERARLLEELGRRAEEEARLRFDREAEIERLSEELRLQGTEGARLRAAVGELARERDQLGAELDRARHERDELAEAKKALEAVHAALAQARARLG